MARKTVASAPVNSSCASSGSASAQATGSPQLNASSIAPLAASQSDGITTASARA